MYTCIYFKWLNFPRSKRAIAFIVLIIVTCRTKEYRRVCKLLTFFQKSKEHDNFIYRKAQNKKRGHQEEIISSFVCYLQTINFISRIKKKSKL